MPIVPYAECPKCNGTTRIPYHGDGMYVATYDAKTKTVACNNCGGQTMSLRATGQSRVDPTSPEGKGCLHEYRGRQAGNCYYVYTCVKCGDIYDIDSSD